MKLRGSLLVVFLTFCLWRRAASGQNVSPLDRDYESVRRQAFLAYNAQYQDQRAERQKRAESLGKRLFGMELHGEDVACAHQIFTEADWLLGATADFRRIDQRLDALENVMEHPGLESAATQQDPSDGSWGSCYTEWFFRLDATYEHFNRDATRDRQPMFPLRLLDRVNSPARLREYFDRVSISNIPLDGTDHERELNESMADLMRLILRDRPSGYTWDPRLKSVVKDIILHHLRNPVTGWWGERYVVQGKPEFVDNLSLTFHIVRYLNGDVPGQQRMVATTIALKDLDDPPGWLSDGHFTDHNNMDVAVLFGFGWKSATMAQRRVISEQIQKLLDWCLSQSLQADGSFALAGDDSVEENTYFGATFLSRIGFFDRSRCFWTEREFPEAQEIRLRIIRFINEHQSNGAAGGAYYESALRELNSSGGNGR